MPVKPHLWEGAISGMISSLLPLVLILAVWVSMPFFGFSGDQMALLLLGLAVVLVFGAIYGILYALAYDYLPSDSPVLKGVIMMAAIWLIGLLIHSIKFTIWNDHATLLVYLVQGAILGSTFRMLVGRAEVPVGHER